MARLRTLAELRDAARDACNQDDSLFVSDAQANARLSSSAARWYAMIGRCDPSRFWASTDIATTAGTQDYALPAAFASVIGCEIVDGTRTIRLLPYNPQERLGVGDTSPSGLRYHVRGSLGTQAGAVANGERIVFQPDPGGRTIRVHYMRAPAVLSADADTVDGVVGWDDWIVFDVAAFMARKADDFELAAQLTAERDKIERDIERDATSRDAGAAPRVARVRRRGI